MPPLTEKPAWRSLADDCQSSRQKMFAEGFREEPDRSEERTAQAC